MERKRALIAFVSLAALAVSGCGGGGGGGTSSAISTSSTVRQIQAGDSLTYDVSGNSRAPVTGTATVTTANATVQPYPNMRTMEVTTVLDLTVGGQPVQSTNYEYLAQDSTGRMIRIGSITDDKYHFGSSFSSDPVHCPSPMAVGSEWSYEVTYEDAPSENVSCKVTALEAVNGRMAYKTEETVKTGQVQTTKQLWLVPDLGYPVKMIWTQPTSAGTLDLIADLKTKSF